MSYVVYAINERYTMGNKRIDNTTCHCLKMRRTAGNVVSFYDNKLAPLGITVRQYSLLNSISELECCSVSSLAIATELERSTLARSLKPLISQGFIADMRKTGSRDSQLILTDSGKEIVLKAEKLWNEAQVEFEKKLSKEQLEALEDIMETLQTM